MAYEVRDATGRFVKGHSPMFLKHKPGHNAGRPRGLKREVRDALQVAEEAMPQLYLDMVRDAQDETIPVAVRQAIREYLSDRIYGKPNQPLSNKDGSKLTSFSFLLPAGFIPSPGGLIGNSDSREDSQKN